MSRTSMRRARERALLTVIVVAAGLAGVAGAGPVAAATVTAGAEADARVAERHPDSNYGTASEFSTDASPQEDSFLRFKVAGTAGAVARAVLRLSVTNGSSDGPAVYPVTGTWDERRITWRNKPARGSTALADVGAAPRGWVEFDVTAAVTGDGTYSFALVQTSSDSTQFASKEAKKNRPQLVLTTGAASTTSSSTTSSSTTSSSTTSSSSTSTSTSSTTSSTTTTTSTSPTTSSTTSTSTSTTSSTTTSSSTTTTAPPAPGTVTRTFDPMADAVVAQEDPTLNFGTTTVLETDAVPVVESYIKFLVGDVTGPVRSAKLRAYVTNGSPNGPAVFTTGVAWSETGLTWANRPARTGGAMDDKGALSAGTWVEWDVTGAVRENDLYSFNIATSSNDGTDVASREAATDRRPRLVVTFDGQPTADTSPPDTVIESAPIGTVLVDNATFSFYASEGGATFACRLDSGSWSPCSSPHTIERLSNGSHTFAVRATDPAGNTDPVPADYSFTVAAVDIRQAMLAPATGAYFGAHVQAADRTEPTVSAAVGQLEAAVGRNLGIDHWYEPWPNVFPTWREPWNFAAGRIPMISWGKWYTDQIARGDHDAYITARADGIKALGQPVMIRWFWEMDGSRNVDYAISPSSYIAAWRRIVTIFRERGVTNAAWVWCPNASGFNNGEAQSWYPGDAWVDWLCADGYNFYPEREDNRSFESTFASFYAWSRQRPKPIVIGEYAALQAGPGDRAAWIDAARTTMKTTMPRILGAVWFHSVHDYDWTLLSEPSAVEAFRRMALDPYFNPD